VLSSGPTAPPSPGAGGEPSAVASATRQGFLSPRHRLTVAYWRCLGAPARGTGGVLGSLSEGTGWTNAGLECGEEVADSRDLEDSHDPCVGTDNVRSWPQPRLHSSPDSARQIRRHDNRPANRKIDVAGFWGTGHAGPHSCDNRKRIGHTPSACCGRSRGPGPFEAHDSRMGVAWHPPFGCLVAHRAYIERVRDRLTGCRGRCGRAAGHPSSASSRGATTLPLRDGPTRPRGPDRAGAYIQATGPCGASPDRRSVKSTLSIRSRLAWPPDPGLRSHRHPKPNSVRSEQAHIWVRT
jgi:hypothetical protein